MKKLSCAQWIEVQGGHWRSAKAVSVERWGQKSDFMPSEGKEEINNLSRAGLRKENE